MPPAPSFRSRRYGPIRSGSIDLVAFQLGAADLEAVRRDAELVRGRVEISSATLQGRGDLVAAQVPGLADPPMALHPGVEGGARNAQASGGAREILAAGVQRREQLVVRDPRDRPIFDAGGTRPGDRPDGL